MAKLSVPILPTNMERVMVTLPASDNAEVIPVDNPTVPMAENSSNISDSNFLSGSVIVRKKVEIKIKDKENKAIENARSIVLIEIVLLYITTWDSPLMVAKADLRITAKVVVFIPPPVEPGDAPTYIRKIKNTSTGTESALISTELNPAVRVETEWKNAVIIFPRGLYPSTIEFHSRKRNTIIPATIRIRLVLKAILAPVFI
jgi:hypothetical protein